MEAIVRTGMSEMVICFPWRKIFRGVLILICFHLLCMCVEEQSMNDHGERGNAEEVRAELLTGSMPDSIACVYADLQGHLSVPSQKKVGLPEVAVVLREKEDAVTKPVVTVPDAPDITAPDITVSDITASDITVADITVPDIIVSDITVSSIVVPESAVEDADVLKPDVADVDVLKPAVADADILKPAVADAAVPEPAVLDAAVPDTAESDVITAVITVTAYGNGGIPEVMEVPFASGTFQSDSLAEPQKMGKLFTGWYEDADCNVAFDGAEEGATDIELYAGWADFPGVVCNDAGHIISCTDSAVSGVVIFPTHPCCTGIECGAFTGMEDRITELYIPANIVYIAPGALDDLRNLFYIEVDSGNPCYYSEFGELYDRAGNLVCVPPGRNAW